MTSSTPTAMKTTTKMHTARTVSTELGVNRRVLGGCASATPAVCGAAGGVLPGGAPPPGSSPGVRAGSGSGGCAVMALLLSRGFPERCADLDTRPHRHPDATVLLVLEHVVGAHALLQRDVVGDQLGRVEIALLDVVEQPGDVALAVLLCGFEGQALVGQNTRRELVGHAVHAEHRHHSALAAGQDCLPQRGGAVGLQAQ